MQFIGFSYTHKTFHLSPNSEIFLPTSRETHIHQHSFPIPTPALAPSNHSSTVPLDLPILDISHTQNQVAFCICLLSISITFPRFVHIVSYNSSSCFFFFKWLNNIAYYLKINTIQYYLAKTLQKLISETYTI